jgi:hypothetical protein
MKLIVRYTKFILAIPIGILLFNLICCSNIASEQSNKYNYDQNKIDSIIAHNNLTIIYLWTEWCYGSRGHFIYDVVPYLQQKSDMVGFISIFYGSVNELEAILLETKCDYPTFRIKSRRGFDKIRMYKLLNSFLKDYKIMNYVPVSVICDKNGNILNYNENEKKYSHITDCIRKLEGNDF